MRATIWVVCACVAVFCSAVMARQDKPVAPVVQAAKSSEVPKFTEVQELKLRLSLSQEQAARQQIALLQVQVQQIGEEREKLLKAVEAEHPGWVVDRETLKFAPVAAKK